MTISPPSNPSTPTHSSAVSTTTPGLHAEALRSRLEQLAAG
ncbi:MAG: hypothetical protein RLZZ423_1677, partial [Cyanobacteriota bacterium]